MCIHYSHQLQTDVWCMTESFRQKLLLAWWLLIIMFFLNRYFPPTDSHALEAAGLFVLLAVSFISPDPMLFLLPCCWIGRAVVWMGCAISLLILTLRARTQWYSGLQGQIHFTVKKIYTETCLCSTIQVDVRCLHGVGISFLWFLFPVFV